MKHICINCSNIFFGRKERKLCSRKCQTKWSKGKKFGMGKPKNRKISVCLICKNEFEHWAGRKAKYCSRNCWNKRNPQILFYCLNCGKEFWDWKSGRDKNVFCSQSCANGFNQRGNKAHFWKGGKTRLSKLLRTRTLYLDWRQKVFKRDDYTCQVCGIKSGLGKRVYIQAHHIKEFSLYPDLIYDISNGKTLCKNCHLLKHSHKF